MYLWTQKIFTGEQANHKIDIYKMLAYLSRQVCTWHIYCSNVYISTCVLCNFSHFRLFATPRTVACQAPLSMGFSRQEYWSGLLCLLPGDLLSPDPCLLHLLHWQSGSLPLAPPGNPVNMCKYLFMGIPGGSDDKKSACNAGDPGSIPESGRSPGEGNGNLLQYSCPENSMDRGRLQSWSHRELTWLSD